MLCLAALHGMVALVGSERNIMQVKKKEKEKKEKERKKRKEKQKGSNLNVYIAMARGECTLSQCANHKRIYTRGNGYNGFF